MKHTMKLLLVLVALFLMSCANIEGDGFRGPVTGLNYKPSEDGGLKPTVDQNTVRRWTSGFSQFLAGKKPKDILKDSLPVASDKP